MKIYKNVINNSSCQTTGISVALFKKDSIFVWKNNNWELAPQDRVEFPPINDYYAPNLDPNQFNISMPFQGSLHLVHTPVIATLDISLSEEGQQEEWIYSFKWGMAWYSQDVDQHHESIYDSLEDAMLSMEVDFVEKFHPDDNFQERSAPAYAFTTTATSATMPYIISSATSNYSFTIT